MNTKARSMDNGAACEKPKLHIQLAGLNHPAGQHFQIFEAGTDKRLTDLEATLEKRTLDDSVIYSWECKPHRTYDIALGIEAGSGPLSLPLFQRLRGSEVGPIKKAQHNLVVPVVPLTWLPCYRPAEADNAIGACRSGYLYLFYQGKAWREIRVDTGENGYEFTDVDLSAFRNSDGFTENRRSASGNTLEEIWLPAKADTGKGGASELLVAFSEVQWSAAYLTHFENNADKAAERLEPAAELSKWQPAFSQRMGNIRSLTHLFPLREREPLRELNLADPLYFARDLSVSYLSELREAATKERNNLEAGGSASTQEFGQHEDFSKLGLDSNARHDALREYALEKELLPQSTKSKTDEGTFTKDLAAKDLIASPCERKIVTLILQDPVFSIRHAVQQLNDLYHYLELILQLTNSQKHGKHATLIQQVIMPEQLAGSENPFYKAASCVDGYLGGKFKRAIREIERINIHSHIEKVKKTLLTLLQQTSTSNTLKDFSGLTGPDKAGLHLLVGKTASALLIESKKIDYLSHDKNSEVTAEAQNYVASILSKDAKHPLYNSLFVVTESMQSQPDTGSLITELTPACIRDWAPNNKLPDPDKLQCLELKLMLENLMKTDDSELGIMLENGEVETSQFPNARRLIHYFDGLISNFSASALALTQEAASLSENLEIKKLHAINDGISDLINRSVGEQFKIFNFEAVSKQYSNRYIVTGAELQTDAPADTSAKKTSGTAPTGDTPRVKYHHFTSSYADVIPAGVAEAPYSTNKKRLNKPVEKTYSLVKLGILEDNKHNSKMVRMIVRMEKMAEAGKRLKLPLVIPIIEIINFDLERRSLRKTAYEKSEFRAASGIMSASGDTGIALAKLYEFTSSQTNFITKNLAKDMNAYTKAADFFDPKRKWMQATMSRLNFAAVGAGAITAALAAWDIYYALRRNDHDAAIAYGLLAAGTTMMTTSSLIAANASLLGLGPIAWLTAGIALAVAGGIALIFTEDAEIEQLLKHGVFGTDPKEDGEAYDWLHNEPEQAYAHLAGLLINLRIRVIPADQLQGLTPKDQKIVNNKRLDTCVSVEYNLPFGLEGINTVKIYAREAIKKCTRYTNLNNGNSESTSSLLNLNSPNLQNGLIVEHSGGRMFFYRTSRRQHKEQQQSYYGAVTKRTHYLAVRAQLRLLPNTTSTQGDKSNTEFVWPRPLLHEVADNKPEDFSKPVFKTPTEPTPYWADEINHGTDDSLSQFTQHKIHN